jgi:molybdate transport system regulatory protein
MLGYILRFMSKDGTDQQYQVRVKLWIEGPEGTFIGYGRAVLLERIREHGSISAAARSMKMSYRHAWKLVDSMNRQGRTPLVTTSTGGKGGGGTTLTEAGERAITALRTAWKGLDEFLGQTTSDLDL